MTARELIDKNIGDIVTLCRRYHVVRLSLFGSALSAEWDEGRSDIDFLVVYGPERFSLDPLDAVVGLQIDLEELLRRKVDVVDADAIRNPVFRTTAQEEAVELYAA
ncbi:MAG: nucleotidyltransferase domain-containing protein [Fimbriimonadales bacterium]